MSEKLLEFSLVTFAADKLELKVKNTSGKDLDRSLAMEFYPPKYLVSKEVIAASVAAATNEKPIGVATLEKVATHPEGWSVWAKREASDSSVTVLLLNDMDQEGNDQPPVKLAAGGEFVVRIPLNTQAARTNVNLLYSYQHGTDPLNDVRIDGQLELKAETTDWSPDVTLRTNHASPTAIPPTTMVRIVWHIEDGVSATLRGPLPEGNSELTLSSDPAATFKIGDGFVEVRVVSAMTFLLQAEVKRPGGGPNVQVVRMLTLDTNNKKHVYGFPRPSRVLPYGLIEVDWAAWGVDVVQLAVSAHTTRTIQLTQQTLGRFFEGSGVMRVSATRMIENVRTTTEAITIDAPGEDPKTKNVQVISWMQVAPSGAAGPVYGLAVIAPKIALLTMNGLHIADVGVSDPAPEKLAFKLMTKIEPVEWAAIAAVEKRFVCLRRKDPSPDFDFVPFNADGTPEAIPPVTPPADIRNLVLHPRRVIDLVGCGKRAYFVVESPPVKGTGLIRRAFSAGFDSATKRSEIRPEPLLEPLMGFRLVSFDNGLYALNRTTGAMVRFDLTKEGTLAPPKKAASAVKRVDGREESMVKDGLLVPVGRVLVVLSPTSVPSLESLEKYGLHNTLNYTSSQAGSDALPQDLIYNPQKDYWARCGHDLDVKPEAVAAFRGGEAARLWVVQPNGDMHPLAVGSESFFPHDYVPKVPTKPLPPYV